MLLAEALAELAGVAAASSDRPGLEGKVGVLTEVSMKFRQKIIPGQESPVGLEAEIIFLGNHGGRANVRAMREGKVVSEGEIKFAMADKSEWPQPQENQPVQET